MRPLRSLLAVLSEAVSALSDAAFALGGDEDVLLARLNERLATLRRQARALYVGGASLLVASVAALATAPAVLHMDGIRHAITSALLLLLLAAGALAALEGSHMVTLIDGLADLLSYGASISRLDALVAAQIGLAAKLSPEPAWDPLVEILCDAYPTIADLRAILGRSRVPLARIDVHQAFVHVWRDALRLAYRCQRLDPLLEAVLSDPYVSAYHEKLQACRAQLDMGKVGTASTACADA